MRSCGHAIVVGGASSSSIHLLATICTRRCFSPLDDDRLSLLGSCSSSSSICSFARIAIAHCVSLSRDDRSVSLVVCSSIILGRFGVVYRRRRRSFVIVHHSSCAIARALSSSVRWLVCIVIVRCVCRLPRSIVRFHSGFLCHVVV